MAFSKRLDSCFGWVSRFDSFLFPRRSATIPAMRLPLAPIACSLLSFVAGYVAFHPGWRKAAPLSDGSAESFRAAAEAISTGDLLEKASPHERFGWLLETCRQPRGYMRDFAMYEAVQRLQPADFLAAFADLEKLGKQMVAMPEAGSRSLDSRGDRAMARRG